MDNRLRVLAGLVLLLANRGVAGPAAVCWQGLLEYAVPELWSGFSLAQRVGRLALHALRRDARLRAIDLLCLLVQSLPV